MHEEDDDETDCDEYDADCPNCGYHKYQRCRCCIDCGAAPGQEHALGCLGAIEP